MPKTTFDIRDSRNRYRPCPICKAELNLCICDDAVQCMNCGCRGPSFKLDPNDILASDLAAFNAWNALERSD